MYSHILQPYIMDVEGFDITTDISASRYLKTQSASSATWLYLKDRANFNLLFVPSNSKYNRWDKQQVKISSVIGNLELSSNS